VAGRHGIPLGQGRICNSVIAPARGAAQVPPSGWSGVPQGTEGEASSLWKVTVGAEHVVVLVRPPAPLTPCCGGPRADRGAPGDKGRKPDVAQSNEVNDGVLIRLARIEKLPHDQRLPPPPRRRLARGHFLIDPFSVDAGAQ
jgi:hypothetical protein